MAAFPVFLPFSDYASHNHHHTMLVSLLLIVFTLSLFSLSIIVFSLYSRKLFYARTKPKQQEKTENGIETPLLYSFQASDENDGKAQLGHGSRATQLTRSIVLEVLPSDSARWAEFFADDGLDKSGSGLDGDELEEKKKKRKKRGKKKRPDPNGGGGGGEEKKKDKMEELGSLFPFTTSSSAIQRKIKSQYDQLVKSHESTGLTLVQVFVFIFFEMLFNIFLIDYPA